MSSLGPVVTVSVNGTSITFSEESYMAYLESNDYCFLQQSNPPNNVLTYAITFNDLVPGAQYTSVSLPLHSVRVGVDSRSLVTMQQAAGDIQQTIDQASVQLQQSLQTLGAVVQILCWILLFLFICYIIKVISRHLFSSSMK